MLPKIFGVHVCVCVCGGGKNISLEILLTTAVNKAYQTNQIEEIEVRYISVIGRTSCDYTLHTGRLNFE